MVEWFSSKEANWEKSDGMPVLGTASHLSLLVWPSPSPFLLFSLLLYSYYSSGPFSTALRIPPLFSCSSRMEWRWRTFERNASPGPSIPVLLTHNKRFDFLRLFFLVSLEAFSLYPAVQLFYLFPFSHFILLFSGCRWYKRSLATECDGTWRAVRTTETKRRWNKNRWKAVEKEREGGIWIHSTDIGIFLLSSLYSPSSPFRLSLCPSPHVSLTFSVYLTIYRAPQQRLAGSFTCCPPFLASA